MVNADLRLFIGGTEYGTIGNPIVFPSVNAGQTVVHSLNPFYLYNDKGGILGSVDANQVTIFVSDMIITGEVLGTTNGTSNQTFNTAYYPIIDTLQTSEIVVMVGVVTWTRVSSFFAVSGTAQVYTINSTTGLITFGNNVNGAIPPSSQTVTISYMPNLLVYGSEVTANSWLGVESTGATSNVVNVYSETQFSSDSTHVSINGDNLQSVTGVWLSTDIGRAGTNYYSGGSFFPMSQTLLLGTPLPSAVTSVQVMYSYTIIDDVESGYTQVSYVSGHTFTNPIPQNNAKLLHFQLVVPPSATSSGGGQVSFRISLQYQQ